MTKLRQLALAGATLVTGATLSATAYAGVYAWGLQHEWACY